MIPQPKEYTSETKICYLSDGRLIKVTNLTPIFADQLQYERQKEYIGHELYNIILRIREKRKAKAEAV